MNADTEVPVLNYATRPKRPQALPVAMLKRSAVCACLGLLAVYFDVLMRGDADVPRKLLLTEILLGSGSLFLIIWALLRGAWEHYKFWVFLIAPAALFCIYFATLHPRGFHN
jgi:hypothetical protein